MLPDEDFTYGMPNRPSTPVKAVVNGYYGDAAEQRITERYELMRAQAKPLSYADARNHTKASHMLSQHVRSTALLETMRSSQTLFKMNRFKNVEPRTNTHNGRRSASFAYLPKIH